jgi:hypothetical protein
VAGGVGVPRLQGTEHPPPAWSPGQFRRVRAAKESRTSRAETPMMIPREHPDGCRRRGQTGWGVFGEPGQPPAGTRLPWVRCNFSTTGRSAGAKA